MRGIEKYFCEYPLDRFMKTVVRILPLGAVCLAVTLQAMGDIRPAGSTDGVSVGLLRTADSFADEAVAAPVVPAAKYSNEWTFERDVDGRSLSEAINSGTNSPLAKFGAGYGNTVFTTNRALRCVGEDAGTDGVWTNGAVLDASLTSTTSGIYYLRYDVDYDLSSPSNNSGTVLGVYFTGDSGAKAAGLVMGYDTGNFTNSIPVNRTLAPIPGATNIAKVGTLSAVAEVNLDSDTLQVWYDLSGSNVFTQGSPAFSTNITMTSLDNLRFHATGDLRPAGSLDYTAVDNIRQAGSWTKIVEAPADLTAPPALQIAVSDSLSGAMEMGETNTVTVVISNSGGPATQVTSALSRNSAANAFAVTSNNTATALGTGASVTNTYELIAKTNGVYSFTVQAQSAETNSAVKNFPIIVGSQISYLTNSVAEVTNLFGGVANGRYEPGEIIDITVFSTNNGARPVSNVVNSLWADPVYFIISNLTSVTYASMSIGASTSTVYRVTIKPNTPDGTLLLFSVTNQAGANVWSDSFELLPSVLSQAQPAVSPSPVELKTVAGSSGTATMVITNSGNAPANFSISDDSVPVVSYAAQTSSGAEWVSTGLTAITLNPPEFGAAADKGLSIALPIGFNFSFYGTSYSHFYVNADGVIGLSSGTATNVGSGAYATLPSGNTPLIAPFWGDLNSPAGSISYRLMTDRLLISYSGVSQNPSAFGGTNLQFQISLYKTGKITFCYKQINGSWLDYVTVGLQGSSSLYTNLNITPVSATTVTFTPASASWISYSPAAGEVAPLGSQTVTLSADAGPKSVGTYPVSLRFGWTSSGSMAGSSSTNVALTVSVVDSDPVMNEWTFETDDAGLMLSQAANSGSEGNTFGSGGDPGLLTDGVGGLLCTYDAENSVGHFLSAPLQSIQSGTVYLRFDLNYDIASALDTVGLLVHTGFRDAGGYPTEAAMRFNRVATGQSASFYYVTQGSVSILDSSLAQAGTLSGILKVNIDARTMDVWYDASGLNQFVQSAPAVADIPVDLSELATMFFQIGGDFPSAGSDDFLTLDNLRMTKSWVSAAAAIETTPRPVYEGPASVSFTGTAGQGSSTSFMISNSGPVDLEFSISNTDAASAGYTVDEVAAYSWVNTSSGTLVTFNDPDANPYITAADEGSSDLLPIGFNFPFYGQVYTNLSISVNGAVQLQDSGRIRALGVLASTATDMPDQMIAPYWGDLVNGSVRYLSSSNRTVITWSGMKQYGLLGSSNITFQAIIDDSGAITFNYSSLSGNPWPTTPIGLRDTSARTASASLIRAGDYTLVTNAISGVGYRQYTNAVTQRAIRFDQASTQLIGYSPARDTVSPGGSSTITLTGDASGYATGSTAWTHTTVLSVSHNASAVPDTIDVIFVVTNSEPVAAAAIALDSDSDGMSDDAERTAGTDPQNSQSVFVVSAKGGRELMWNAAEGRTYTVQWTDNLTKPFELLATGVTGGQYVDTEHADVPVLYYRVTIEQ